MWIAEKYTVGQWYWLDKKNELSGLCFIKRFLDNSFLYFADFVKGKFG